MKIGHDKHHDFKVLKDASNLLLEKLRSDESVPDLKDQFNERYDSGNHRYFVEPFHKQWNSSMVCIRNHL